MKEINTEEIGEAVRRICGRIAFDYPPEILSAMKEARETETGSSRDAMDMLMENAAVAHGEHIPICQDTGMVTVYLSIGQDVHLTGRDLETEIQEKIALAYQECYLRASVVDDPVFARKNTGTNTPGVIYTKIVPGERVAVEVTAKGFGSENMSKIKMLKPAEGAEGIKQFVLDTIREAGPNACPPMIVGVGIGGTFDYSAVLAKKALLRDFHDVNPDPRYAEMEKEILTEANRLRIGPMGLHGHTTALHVSILTYPTHIAGMPCAVNICCHACRHDREVIG